MQYQGGKSRIAKNISEVIITEVSRWEEQNCFNNCGSYQREREREREQHDIRVIILWVLCSRS